MRPIYMASFPLLLLASSPAYSQISENYPDIDSVTGTGTTTQDVEQIAERMADPAMQDHVANMIEAMSDALMQLPVGKFAEAIENARPGTVSEDVQLDSTLADLAGPAASELPARLGDQMRFAMNMMGKFATALAAMLPEFEQLGADLESQMRKTLQHW